MRRSLQSSLITDARADRRSYEAVVQPRSDRSDCAIFSVHFPRLRRKDARSYGAPISTKQRQTSQGVKITLVGHVTLRTRSDNRRFLHPCFESDYANPVSCKLSTRNRSRAVSS